MSSMTNNNTISELSLYYNSEGSYLNGFFFEKLVSFFQPDYKGTWQDFPLEYENCVRSEEEVAAMRESIIRLLFYKSLHKSDNLINAFLFDGKSVRHNRSFTGYLLSSVLNEIPRELIYSTDESDNPLIRNSHYWFKGLVDITLYSLCDFEENVTFTGYHMVEVKKYFDLEVLAVMKKLQVITGELSDLNECMSVDSLYSSMKSVFGMHIREAGYHLLEDISLAETEPYKTLISDIRYQMIYCPGRESPLAIYEFGENMREIVRGLYEPLEMSMNDFANLLKRVTFTESEIYEDIVWYMNREDPPCKLALRQLIWHLRLYIKENLVQFLHVVLGEDYMAYMRNELALENLGIMLEVVQFEQPDELIFTFDLFKGRKISLRETVRHLRNMQTFYKLLSVEEEEDEHISATQNERILKRNEMFRKINPSFCSKPKNMRLLLIFLHAFRCIEFLEDECISLYVEMKRKVSGEIGGGLVKSDEDKEELLDYREAGLNAEGVIVLCLKKI